MKSYLSLIPISARVRRRQNRLTILCIVTAVFLVTAIFSVADMMLRTQTQTRQALDGLAERAWMVEASRKRVGCLPLAPAEVEKRIQTVLQAPDMPESWERRRAR